MILTIIIVAILAGLGISLWFFLEGINNMAMVQSQDKSERWIPVSNIIGITGITNTTEEYICPECGQSCSKEEYESGYCLDCDQIEMGI